MTSSASRRCTWRRSTSPGAPSALLVQRAWTGAGRWTWKAPIREHQAVMALVRRAGGIPVELNEPHHWGMRDAPDVIFVVAAYLSAYNARAFGVTDYIAQLMFNSPPGLVGRDGPGEDVGLPGADRAPGRRAAFPHLAADAVGLLSYPLDPDAGAGTPGGQRSTCRWRCSRTSCTSSGTPRPITPPPPRT